MSIEAREEDIEARSERRALRRVVTGEHWGKRPEASIETSSERRGGKNSLLS
jgi:hypothetical protein